MPYSPPTLRELISQTQNEVDSRLRGADSRLRRSFLRVLATVNAGLTYGLYGFLSFIFKQIFPDTSESIYLERWARIWGIERNPATLSSGLVAFTGSDGAAINQGELLTRSDGLQFQTTESGIIAGGSLELPVEALLEGVSGNTEADSSLTFVSTPPNLDSSATVLDGLTGGQEVENDSSLLLRLLLRIQEPPHGGAAHDYVAWALEVPGVTRAWVYPLELGLGTVTVRFMMDETYPDGIPEAGDVDLVQSYIEERRPVTADVTVVAPVPVGVDFQIQLNSNDTPETRSAVEAELAAMVRRDAQPGNPLYLSRINEAISIAPGEFEHILLDPVANVEMNTGEIPVLGVVGFI